jgi:hypothetical protein
MHVATHIKTAFLYSTAPFPHPSENSATTGDCLFRVMCPATPLYRIIHCKYLTHVPYIITLWLKERARRRQQLIVLAVHTLV